MLFAIATRSGSLLVKGVSARSNVSIVGRVLLAGYAINVIRCVVLSWVVLGKSENVSQPVLKLGYLLQTAQLKLQPPSICILEQHPVSRSFFCTTV